MCRQPATGTGGVPPPPAFPWTTRLVTVADGRDVRSARTNLAVALTAPRTDQSDPSSHGGDACGAQDVRVLRAGLDQPPCPVGEIQNPGGAHARRAGYKLLGPHCR